MSAQTELVLQTIVKWTEKATKALDDVKSSLDWINKSAIDASKWTQTFTKKLENQREWLLALWVASWLAFYGITSGIKSSVKEAVKFENALVGLKSIADWTGKDFVKAKEFIQEFTKDGLITAWDAATSLKSLFQRGFSLEESVVLLNRFKDSASFGRQSALWLWEAVRWAAEWLKNENSMLVDNAWVTKNVAKMWEEYANKIWVKTTAMTLDQKREAEYQGILAETKFQVWDATKYAEWYAWAVAKQDAATLALQQTIGTALLPAMTKITEAITWILTPIIAWSAEHPKLVSWIIMTTTVILWLTTALIALWLAIWPITAAIALLWTVIWAISAPVLLVVWVLWVLSKAFYEIYQNWATVKPMIIKDWESFKTMISSIVFAIGEYIEKIFNWIIAKIDYVIDYLSRKASIAKNFVDSIMGSYEQSSVGKFLWTPWAIIWDYVFWTPSWWNISWARATWWPVSWGSSYLVWERWPEIFTPWISGNITPNNKLWGSSIVINISGVFGRDAVDQIGDAIVGRLKQASYI